MLIIFCGDLDQRLKRIEAQLAVLSKQGVLQMATAKEVKELALGIATSVGPLANAINALEAAVTALKAQVGTIPADVQQDLDDAFAALRGVSDGVNAAVADATDGVDEAAPTPPPIVSPAPEAPAEPTA